jgi:hypothetical protein
MCLAPACAHKLSIDEHSPAIDDHDGIVASGDECVCKLAFLPR